jgi:hypothetical protein
MKIAKLIGVSAIVSLSACMQAPDDTESLRSMSDSSMLMTTKDYRVDRPLSAVNASLRAGAEKCFQRVSSTTIYSGGYGGYGPAGNFATKYTYSYKRTATGAQLALHGKMTEKSWNVVNVDKNGGYMFMAETSASGSQTALRLFTPRFGAKDLNEKVAGWAAGQHLYCPML